MNVRQLIDELNDLVKHEPLAADTEVVTGGHRVGSVTYGVRLIDAHDDTGRQLRAQRVVLER